MARPAIKVNPWVTVGKSKIHGKGLFASKRIPKGTRVIEYLGEHITHQEADDRYGDDDQNNNHTFLFVLNKKIVIDATLQGNDARYINHICEGNCESSIDGARIFIDSARVIQKGEELGYDYELGRDEYDPPNIDEIFACHCGSLKCRSTMLFP